MHYILILRFFHVNTNSDFHLFCRLFLIRNRKLKFNCVRLKIYVYVCNGSAIQRSDYNGKKQIFNLKKN